MKGLFFFIAAFLYSNYCMAGDIKIYERISGGMVYVYTVSQEEVGRNIEMSDEVFLYFSQSMEKYIAEARQHSGRSAVIHEVRLKRAMTQGAYDYWFVIVGFFNSGRNISDRLGAVVMTLDGIIIDPYVTGARQ